MIDYSYEPWQRPEFNDAPDWQIPKIDVIGMRDVAADECQCEACDLDREEIQKTAATKWKDIDIVKWKEDKELTDAQHLICPRVIYAYVLNERKWRKLKAHRLKP